MRSGHSGSSTIEGIVIVGDIGTRSSRVLLKYTMDATNAKRSDTVDKLRKLFSDPKFCPEPISAYIISHDDQHMSEYLADGEKRLEFVSGFSGSAGTLVITLEKAFLWTDARYYIQASEELEHPFELKETDATSETPGQWLAKNLSSGDRVGADPALFSCSSWKELRSEMRKTGVNLVEITTNLVDIIWLEKPPAPSNPVVVLPPKYSGLLNLRGSDIEYNPVFFSFVVIHVNNGITEVQLYCKSSQLPTPEIKEHLKLEGAKIEMHQDGTTDVTRTVHLGVPTDYQKECFTRVLKGVIALNTARFPQKLKSYVLDAFARRALWDVGLEYGHGTGHGIGAYLCVHEGPMSISWRPRPDDSGLEADMFVSNGTTHLII
ncbi:unnamed protein product [Nesidiocoris tenuis]|uniref:Creatinase N-terminal domain-containing protein n=1 Tax=Nesidiocoris tenuis TaxID=355587 RepID=A0A6H5H6W6_9HEMI|nr:unnamed protein product [Nesidiocoris tenuis]